MHTLNELTAVLAANYTESEFCEAIANLTGWEYDAESRRIYLSSTHKIFFEFEDSVYTDRVLFKAYFTSDVTGGAVSMYSNDALITNGATFWYHKSTDESVTYLGVRTSSSVSTPGFIYIIANDVNGDEALICTYAEYMYIGVKELSERTRYFSVGSSYNSNQKYFLTKLINPWSGVEFKELYLTMNSQARIPTNHLVRFDNGIIMRLIHRISSVNSYSGLAFPVSEG